MTRVGAVELMTINGSEREVLTEWIDLDFRPAVSGWRVVSLSGDGRSQAVAVAPLAGWLLQLEVRGFAHATSGRFQPGDQRPEGLRKRRVVPAQVATAAPDVAAVVPCGGDRFYGVVGPDEPVPALQVVRAALTGTDAGV